MNKSNLNAVIIGTGMIAHVHFRSLKASGINVLGVVDADPQHAKEVANKWGTQAFDSFEQVINNEKVDVIHICTPNRFHHPMAKQALLAGKHVICEKPLATNLEDALELQHIAKQQNLITGVPFVYRYHPMVREAKARIEKGEIGVLHLIHGSYLQDWLLEQSDNNWRVDPKQGGASRAFADIGSHWCDLIEWITGERFISLISHFHTAQKERSTATAESFSGHVDSEPTDSAPVTTEDIANLLLITNQQTPTTLTISQVSAGRKNRLWFEIDGSLASLEFDQETPEQLWIGKREARTLLVRDPTMGSDEQKRLSHTPAGHAQGYSHCFDAFISDFYDTVLGNSTIGLPNFDDGVRAARIIDAALTSTKQKQWITITE